MKFNKIMDQNGTYQDQIPALSSLDIRSYERIFKVFEASSYDKNFYYYNILKKIEIPELDSIYIDYVDITIKTPLTTVSYNLYNDIKSWWILYIMNKDKFQGPPFWVDGGVQLKYLKSEFRTLLYNEITKNTVFGGRHF
jgi:hypothetical protein